MRKCSFCIQRIDRGQEPACVAKCTTDALVYFSDAPSAGDIAAYGKDERLHMVYKIDGRPYDYSLPMPVPLNTLTSVQGWKWLMGLLPGGALLAWMLKKVEEQEKENE